MDKEKSNVFSTFYSQVSARRSFSRHFRHFLKSSKKDFPVKKRERAKTSKLWNGSEKPNFRFLRRSLSA